MSKGSGEMSVQVTIPEAFCNPKIRKQFSEEFSLDLERY